MLLVHLDGINLHLIASLIQCDDPSCSVRNCLESQILMSHYKNCPDQDCEICGPVNEKLRDDYCKGVKRRLTFEDEVCAAKKVPRLDH